MYPASPRPVVCPYCLAVYRHGSPLPLREEETEICWSDGLFEGETSLPDLVARCQQCGGFFVTRAAIDHTNPIAYADSQKLPWLNSSISLDEFLLILNNQLILRELTEQYLKVHRSRSEQRELDPDEYFSPVKERQRAVTNEDVTDFALNLRLNMLFKINDEKRAKKNIAPETNEIFRNVARQVVDALDEDNDYEILQKAEFNRNIGRFSEALRLLKKVKSRKNRTWKRKLFWASVFRNPNLMIVYRKQNHHT